MPAPDLDFLDSVEIGVDAIGLPERHQIIVVGEGVDENSDRLSLSRYADAIRVICLENLADEVWRLIGDVGDRAGRCCPRSSDCAWGAGAPYV